MVRTREHLMADWWTGHSPVKRRPKVARLKKLARRTLAWWM